MPEICAQWFHMHETPLLLRLLPLTRATAQIIKLPVVQRCPLQPGSQDDLLMVHSELSVLLWESLNEPWTQGSNSSRMRHATAAKEHPSPSCL